MGLLTHDPEVWFAAGAADTIAAADVDEMIARRETARAERNFQEADRIRDELAELGVLIEDSADGTRWRFNNE
jgi:cysteinyl-tRNA synthetase